MKLKNALLGMFTAAALLAVSGCQKAEAPAPAQTEAETAKETEAVKAEAETAGTEAADRNGQHYCRNCTPDRLRKSKQVFFRVSPVFWYDPDAISEDASDWIDFVCLVLVKSGLFQ